MGTHHLACTITTRQKCHRLVKVSHVSSECCMCLSALPPNSCTQTLWHPQVFTATFHTTMANEAMITLAYHKPLDDTWQEAATKLRADLTKALGASCRQLHIIGRSRKQKICLDADYVTDVMEVEGRQYQYRQVSPGRVCRGGVQSGQLATGSLSMLHSPTVQLCMPYHCAALLL